MSATALAPTNGSIATANPSDQTAILRALKLDPHDANTQALVLTCNRYGLDPLLKHAVLISGSLYVTRDGLMHVAHASGRFDGMEVEQLAETQTHYVARASVWRKDMARPFTFQGRYPKQGKSGPGATHGPEMAEKVAVCRALRHAFDVSLCSREEVWDRDEEEGAAAPVRGQVMDGGQEAQRRQPYPPVSLSPETVTSIQAFGDAAHSAGIGIGRAGDRWSPRSCREAALSVLGRGGESQISEEQWRTPDPWIAAKALVEDRPIIAGESTGPEELTDPFADNPPAAGGAAS